MSLITPIPNGAIVDTVAAVLQAPAYAERGSVSIWSILLQWIVSVLSRLFGLVAAQSIVGTITRTTLAIAAILIGARLAYLLFLRYAPAQFARRQTIASRGADWWAAAQRLAEQGDFTGAAHALYLALLTVVARRGFVALHSSKTTGDYLRELRPTAAVFDVARFADFTRSYETVVYGIGSCDADRYARLYAIAGSILGPEL